MAKVLVIGGAGYIGSHVAKALVRAGHEVAILDDFSTGFERLARYGKLFEGSILNKPFLHQVFRDFHPDAVMHFAGRIQVGESVTDPAQYYEVNVVGTLNILETIRAKYQNTKFIFSSTCAIYGESNEPLHENLPHLPVSPYGRTKKVVEDILSDFSKAYGIQYISLRYFNAAGADADAEIGEMHDPETHLIPRLLQLSKLGTAAEPVQIFGNDYPTPDGTCIRDYIHVEDLAEAHLLAMNSLLRSGESAVFNLGTAKGNSVLEVLHTVEKVTGKKLNISIGPRRPGDAVRLIADSSKIQKAFSWKPKHDLESIVRSAWKWTQQL